MKFKKKLLGVCITVIVLALIAGSTIAYFTDTDSAKNVFTVGDVDVSLFETKVEKTTEGGVPVWKFGTETVSQNTYSDIFPGAVLPKDPTVKNIGSEPAYIRINIKMPASALCIFGVQDLDSLTEEAFAAACEGYDPIIWNMDKQTDADNVVLKFTCNKLFEEGDPLLLFKSVTIPGSLTAEDLTSIGASGEFSMDITADAIQAATFANAVEAFEAFDAA